MPSLLRACSGFALSAALVLASAPQVGAVERRWEQPEKAYADRNVAERIGVNVRDGVLGVFDSLVQGGFSLFSLLSPRGGSLVKKVSTVVGDVVGVVDNNPATQYVFRGIFSRQFLRFGAGAQGIVPAIGHLHDTEFAAPGLTLDDYVGDRWFHTRAYTSPSIFAQVGAVVVSDVLVRPAGSLITIFGMREQGDRLDDWGIDLIKRSGEVEFF